MRDFGRIILGRIVRPERKLCRSRVEPGELRVTVQSSRFRVQQAVEKQLACFDLAQHERIFARDLKTYSVRPELGRRVNGVFQQPVEL
jgi:hypothetical protein